MAIHKLTDLKIRAKLREIQELSFSPKAMLKKSPLLLQRG